jgi:biopolymer transport protein ExbD
VKLQRTLNPSFGLLLLLPVVDVAAVLLLFLLVGGGFLLQPGVAVRVPESPFLLAPQRDPLVVSITAEPSPAIYFDNRRIDAAELDIHLAGLDGGARTLIVKADRRAPVDLLVRVTSIAVQRGFPVVLATAEKK